MKLFAKEKLLIIVERTKMTETNLGQMQIDPFGECFFLY